MPTSQDGQPEATFPIAGSYLARYCSVTEDEINRGLERYTGWMAILAGLLAVGVYIFLPSASFGPYFVPAFCSVLAAFVWFWLLMLRRH